MNFISGILTGSHRAQYPASGASIMDHKQSDTIRVARVLCILFMMSTHAWPGADRILAADAAAVSASFYTVMAELLGHASVPLLSLLSGVLLVRSFERGSPADLLITKIKTLLVPLCFWSLVASIALVGKSLVKAVEFPTSILGYLNLIFALTEGPANGPLYFLREIFVMTLYGTVVLLIFERSTKLGCVAAIGIVLVEQMPGGFLLFRGQIAVMFISGLLLARFGKMNWVPSWPLVAAMLLVFAIAKAAGWLGISPDQYIASKISELLPRIAIGLLAWRTAYEVACRPTRLRRYLLLLEPHIFTVFCTHALVASGFGLLALLLGWTEHHAAYPLLLVSQLAVFVAVGVVVSHLMTPFPWLRGKGGRAAPRAPLQPTSNATVFEELLSGRRPAVPVSASTAPSTTLTGRRSQERGTATTS